MTKTSAGNFCEDFRLGQTIRNATPRTVTPGDAARYTGRVGRRGRGLGCVWGHPSAVGADSGGLLRGGGAGTREREAEEGAE